MCVNLLKAGVQHHFVTYRANSRAGAAVRSANASSGQRSLIKTRADVEIPQLKVGRRWCWLPPCTANTISTLENVPFVPLEPLATVEKFGPVWRTITECLRPLCSSQGEKLTLRPKRREGCEDTLALQTEFNPLVSISGTFSSGFKFN